MRLLVILALSIITCNITYSEKATFTMSAEVERSQTINIEKDFVKDYIQNIDIYPRFFPNIVSVKNINETDSEWIYRVEPPLAPAYDLIFILRNKSSGDTLVLESLDKERDYLFCKAALTEISEKKSKISFLFKISMTREKASDIHFLAGILGEKFLSERMKEKLEEDLETFISKATRDMYIARRTSSK